jgi:integrase/recombinase XerD
MNTEKIIDNHLVDAFGKDCQIRMTEKTSKEYQSVTRKFLVFINDRNTALKDVDNNVLRDFLGFLKDERKLAYKTIKDYYTALSQFYEYLIFEELTDNNIILPFRRRYLRRYKEGFDQQKRQIISIEDMSRLVNSALDIRDKAIMLTPAKTGIRREEQVRIDVDDIDWVNNSITLKPTPKRSNRIVFFDDETAQVLRRWLIKRSKLNPQTNALFINYNNMKRLKRSGIYNVVVKYAERLGFHDPTSEKLEDRFGHHCFRHWFTTWLLRSEMKREYVKELRRDKRKEAIDIYYHIDKEDLRRQYLAHIPKLGV